MTLICFSLWAIAFLTSFGLAVMTNEERQQHLLKLTQLRLTIDKDHGDEASRLQHEEIDQELEKAVERLAVYNDIERVHVVGCDASPQTAMAFIYTLGSVMLFVLFQLIFPEGTALF